MSSSRSKAGTSLWPVSSMTSRPLAPHPPASAAAARAMSKGRARLAIATATLPMARMVPAFEAVGADSRSHFSRTTVTDLKGREFSMAQPLSLPNPSLESHQTTHQEVLGAVIAAPLRVIVAVLTLLVAALLCYMRAGYSWSGGEFNGSSAAMLAAAVDLIGALVLAIVAH